MIAFAPVGALINADAGFMALGSGVYSGCPDYATSKAAINHAVLIVGYDSDGNYIVKNSWDTSWGVNGFGTVSKDADCALKAYVYEIRGTNEQLYSASFTKVALLAFLSLLFCPSSNLSSFVPPLRGPPSSSFVLPLILAHLFRPSGPPPPALLSFL